MLSAGGRLPLPNWVNTQSRPVILPSAERGLNVEFFPSPLHIIRDRARARTRCRFALCLPFLCWICPSATPAMAIMFRTDHRTLKPSHQLAIHCMHTTSQAPQCQNWPRRPEIELPGHSTRCILSVPSRSRIFASQSRGTQRPGFPKCTTSIMGELYR